MVTQGRRLQRIMWVVWPAFLMAGVAETLFFTLVDPEDLNFFGASIDLSRQAVYTIGFISFWMLCAASSALTVFLESSPWETHRCPLDAEGRPVGCPRSQEPAA
jgi:hypothetical protein